MFSFINYWVACCQATDVTTHVVSEGGVLPIFRHLLIKIGKSPSVLRRIRRECLRPRLHKCKLSWTFFLSVQRAIWSSHSELIWFSQSIFVVSQAWGKKLRTFAHSLLKISCQVPYQVLAFHRPVKKNRSLTPAILSRIIVIDLLNLPITFLTRKCQARLCRGPLLGVQQIEGERKQVLGSRLLFFLVEVS